MSIEEGEMQEMLSEVKVDFSAASIAQMLDTLNRLVGQMSEKYFYDQNLGTQMANALAALTNALGKQKIDLSPVTQLASELATQNKMIIARLDELSKPTPVTDNTENQRLLRMLIQVVQKNNELHGREMPMQPLSTAMQITDERTIEWEFLSIRDRNGNIKTVAKAR